MITYEAGHLWGMAGGQLEYVSQRIEWERGPLERWYPIMVVRFTDHDVKWGDNKDLIDGKYYELKFPMHQE